MAEFGFSLLILACQLLLSAAQAARATVRWLCEDAFSLVVLWQSSVFSTHSSILSDGAGRYGVLTKSMRKRS